MTVYRNLNLFSGLWFSVFSLLVGVAACQSFPPGFQFGAATSAYQIEGSWNASDKSPSVWDHWTKLPGSLFKGDTGEVACDSYRRWRDDVQIVEDLGLDFYRFSISWPRMLPSGFPDRVSDAGYRFYSDLIDELLRRDIQPVVTIYHWDLPKSLFDLGGWSNPLMVDWLVDYARVLFTLFGSRVTHWITINEPLVVCEVLYSGVCPGVKDRERGTHLCARHVMLAHAQVYRMYEREFKNKYHGKLSIANQIVWSEPLSPIDQKLTELVREYHIGRYSHPIYSKEGGWPPSVEKYMAEKSKKEGYTRSRMPPFTQKEIEMIRGTYDYYALNHYTTHTVRTARLGEVIGKHPMFDIPELGAKSGKRPEWVLAPNGWLQVYPEGLRAVLVWLKQHYGPLEIRIMENGYPTSSRSRADDDRVQYLRNYMEQVLLAIKDGVNVTAYTVWSLMDNFEWFDGYKTKFGLYDVDFGDILRSRRPRKSALFYRDVVRARSLAVPEPQIREEL